MDSDDKGDDTIKDGEDNNNDELRITAGAQRVVW